MVNDSAWPSFGTQGKKIHCSMMEGMKRSTPTSARGANMSSSRLHVQCPGRPAQECGKDSKERWRLEYT